MTWEPSMKTSHMLRWLSMFAFVQFMTNTVRFKGQVFQFPARLFIPRFPSTKSGLMWAHPRKVCHSFPVLSKPGISLRILVTFFNKLVNCHKYAFSSYRVVTYERQYESIFVTINPIASKIANPYKSIFSIGCIC
jgi:hypothetical protein